MVSKRLKIAHFFHIFSIITETLSSCRVEATNYWTLKRAEKKKSNNKKKANANTQIDNCRLKTNDSAEEIRGNLFYYVRYFADQLLWRFAHETLYSSIECTRGENIDAC